LGYFSLRIYYSHYACMHVWWIQVC
jgi:hypothetical protein